MPDSSNRGRGVRAARAARRRIVYSSNQKWKARVPKTYKYVDDNLQVNVVNMETAAIGRDEGGRYRDKHGMECQNSFRYMVRRAEERGMKVNSSKTAIICVSGTQSYRAESHIFDTDSNII